MATLAVIPGPQPIYSANLLDAFSSVTTTQAATTLLTVPAGRTWVGVITLQCACGEAAAGAVAAQATGIVATAGTNVTPAAGNYLRCTAYAGANAASGLVGDSGSGFAQTHFVVIAPAANSVTLTLQTVNAGTFTEVNCTAVGELIPPGTPPF